ncbi:MAG: ArsR family transcriptional regulator [Proteobacteria bacterium]|nr:ArsR family transcriptional regulator [Pseudomonadota bacterium]
MSEALPEGITRVLPSIVYNRVQFEDALLVCAYESDLMTWAMELEGAISAKEFRERLSGLSKNQEIYFYCA